MINNIYKIIDNIESSSLKKRLDNIKLQIINDSNATKLINNFNNAKELYQKYNMKEEFVQAKKELLKNELIKEYIDIQNQINYITLYINKKLKEITKE